MDKKIRSLLIGTVLTLAFAFLFSFVSAVDTQNVCCEKTTNGLFCQDSTADKCLSTEGFRQAPTACRSTSFCKLGVCYDSDKGTCATNTPQKSCIESNGTWSEKSPDQCSLGCCILGDQAAFVTLVRCKNLAANLGLQTNYNKGITSEAQCILSVQNQDKGACVYSSDFERTCKFTTRAECSSGVSNGTFYKNKLCSSEELGTNCKKTKQTTCIDGKDEVYFVDSCGNPANIYDASMADKDDYWTNVKSKLDSCDVNNANGNANSKDCGNCNYLLGGYCRSVTSKINRPTYGDNMCASLNCPKTQNGKSYKHGESWCVYADEGEFGNGDAPVGSRFYKHLCINGEEVVEQCADFRQEECIEDKITSTGTTFSQAACRVNRWQDCVAQDEEIDCLNSDRRDCVWKSSGGTYTIANSYGTANRTGICVPNIPPGLKFWGDTSTTNSAPAEAKLLGSVTTESKDYSDEAKAICSQATFKCTVTLTSGLFDDSADAKCEEDSWINVDWFDDEDETDKCACWDDEKKTVKQEWVDRNIEICKSLGDCGPKINWIGAEGYTEGYNVSIVNVEEDDSSSSGGLFG